MLILETIAKIRRAFFVQGKSIKLICREGDVAISANQAIQGPVITAAAAPGSIGWGRSRVQHAYRAGAVRLNHPRRDLARSIGVCPACPPTP